jgi:hypothetical protein
LIAASVWITPRIALPLGDSISRSRPLMTPVESVWSSPNGLPIAKEFCPTCRSLDVPSASARRPDGGSILSTAMSKLGSAPTSCASKISSEFSVT